MRYATIITSAGLVVALALAAPFPAFAQGRGRGRAMPRGSVRVVRPPVVRVVPVPSYRSYQPRVNFGFFYGPPGYYGLDVYRSPFYGYGYSPYAYPSYAYPPYGYGYSGYSGRPYGGLRVDLPQRDAEVYVDGYFVGTVNDFDGVFQQANLEAGPHRIEVRASGFETSTFDVNIEPDRTITYRAPMHPVRP